MNIRNPKDLGYAIRTVRRALDVTQDQLALASGTNRRFVIELEKGKPTSQTGKVLLVLGTLGVGVTLVPPPGVDLADGPADAPEDRHGPAA